MGGQAQNKLQQTLIDFKAIPQANKTDGNQDRFELFARDFVKALGYEVEEQPGRGQDGGKDLLIRESLRGILQTIPRRWLLSAKHFAHSGRAVGTKDEINIRDRVDTSEADGFLGFYSTLPSSGLIKAFKGLKKHIQVDHFDSARIGQYLLTDRRLDSVFKYYFPESYSQFLKMGGYQAATTSEVQWECAWQAESSTPFHFGETITPDVANYDSTYTYANGPEGEYRKQTTPVGMFPANAWGLNDMHGNVWEWCFDHWHRSYDGAPCDGSAWVDDEGTNPEKVTEKGRLLRGGSWGSSPKGCRSAYRNHGGPVDADINVGFRVVCLPQDPSLNP